MLNILIVDDNEDKRRQIEDAINAKIAGGVFESSGDIIGAKYHLLHKQFDLMILDIQLPQRAGQDVKKYGGTDLLAEIYDDTRLLLPTQIILLTEFEDSFNALKILFEDKMVPLVKYDQYSEVWKNILVDTALHLIETQNRIDAYNKENYEYEVGIICALCDPELKSILDVFGNWSRNNTGTDSTNFYTQTIDRNGKTIKIVAAAASQMGMTATAVLATKMVSLFMPRYLIMTGIAAGIRKQDINYGDILIADPSFDYGQGKIDENGIFQPDYRQMRIAPKLLAKLNDIKLNGDILERIKSDCPYLKPDNQLRMHIGPFASGASVLADGKTVEGIIHHNRKLIGIDMEAYSVYYAAEHCSNISPMALSIKSVSDFADASKSDKYHSYAAYTSASFLKELVINHLEY